MVRCPHCRGRVNCLVASPSGAIYQCCCCRRIALEPAHRAGRLDAGAASAYESPLEARRRLLKLDRLITFLWRCGRLSNQQRAKYTCWHDLETARIEALTRAEDADQLARLLGDVTM